MHHTNVVLLLLFSNDLGTDDFLSLEVLSCSLCLYFPFAKNYCALTVVLVLVFLFAFLDFVFRVNQQVVVRANCSFVLIES